jgi:squalene-associated FAD-dependent desaturase
MRVAVVGAGWAGLAAAVTATQAGHHATLFEASRHAGGRARRLDVQLPDGSALPLDNGQHILIGAYTETLRLMRQVGVEPRDVLVRLPLTLRFPDGTGLALPDWPAPWDAAWGIASERGWSARDKLSLLRTAGRWRLAGFECADDLTVDGLCKPLAPRVVRELVEPLCVSALNTPMQQASARVFLRVLRDSLFAQVEGPWAGSNLLIPNVHLGAVLPDAALRWLAEHGADVRLAARVRELQPSGMCWLANGEAFDALILACPVADAMRLLEPLAEAQDWIRIAAGLQHEPIATVYTTGPALPLPMLALRSSEQQPAQFVFDRAQLGAPSGLLAWVVSASRGDADTIERQVLGQARSLGWAVEPVKTIVDKRATFACTAGLQRPAMQVAPGLLACGDYVDGPYPATLEGAIRSATAAVRALSGTDRTAAAGR